MRDSRRGAELSETVSRILAEGGFESEAEAMRDLSLTIALAKVSRYERECARFKHKYNLDFTDFLKGVEGKIDNEDFEAEDDLKDWEFAWRALNLWKRRVKILKNA